MADPGIEPGTYAPKAYACAFKLIRRNFSGHSARVCTSSGLDRSIDTHALGAQPIDGTRRPSGLPISQACGRCAFAHSWRPRGESNSPIRRSAGVSLTTWVQGLELYQCPRAHRAINRTTPMMPMMASLIFWPSTNWSSSRYIFNLGGAGGNRTRVCDMASHRITTIRSPRCRSWPRTNITRARTLRPTLLNDPASEQHLKLWSGPRGSNSLVQLGRLATQPMSQDRSNFFDQPDRPDHNRAGLAKLNRRSHERPIHIDNE